MNSLKNKKVLVTGGCGFIGSHLVDRLIDEKPEEIIVMDNFFLGKEDNLDAAKERLDGIHILKSNATDFEETSRILREENIDTVFNLAVIPLPTSLVKPRWTLEVNNAITTNLCELLREGAFETLIHCSSSEAYGTAIDIPMAESHPLNCTTPYAASKAACDHVVLSYCRTFEVDACIIRPFNNYGPRQNERVYAGIIPTTVRRILEGKGPVIFGDGEQTRDYLYVTDTANALVSAYRNNNTRGKVINIGSGVETTINNIVKIISEQMGYSNMPIYKSSRIGDVRRHCADITLAKDLLDFKPQVGLEEGLTQTVKWYVKNLGGNGK